MSEFLTQLVNLLPHSLTLLILLGLTDAVQDFLEVLLGLVGGLAELIKGQFVMFTEQVKDDVLQVSLVHTNPPVFERVLRVVVVVDHVVFPVHGEVQVPVLVSETGLVTAHDLYLLLLLVF